MKMDILCIILFLFAASLWFFANEFDSLFGIYGATCAVRRVSLIAIVLVVLLAALWFSSVGDVSASVSANLPSGGFLCEDVLLMLLACMIPLAVLKFFGVQGSMTYSMLGAMAAVAFLKSDGSLPQPGFVLSLLTAPLMSFILAVAVRFLFKVLLSGVRIHMIVLSHYMRHAVIAGLILTASAFGLNWGGFLDGFMAAAGLRHILKLAAVSVVGVTFVGFMCRRSASNDEQTGMFADFSIYAVVTVGFSVAVTLAFFSFDVSAELIGLQPAPLSVTSLVMAATAGTEVAQKSRSVQNEEYLKSATAMFAAPLGALVLAYGFLTITGADAQEKMSDFIVMAAAIMILLSLAFAGYVRLQRRSREATERLVYVQQQQIYEHSRALNDMELKVVLSENQALHNAVEQKRQEVMNVALSIVEQKEFLESLDAMVKRLSKTDDPQERDAIIAELGSALKQRLSYDRDVDSQYFYAQAESLHEDFNAKLAENFPALTQQERRLATLLRLGFSSKYIATLMSITPKSVEISRYRLRQKLGLAKGDNLVNFIKSI